MRILVVGSGAREHAMVWCLAQNPSVDRLFAAPGNAGIASEATCLPVDADDIAAVIELVEREGIDLTVVGPEAPLVGGLVDSLESRGYKVFGPSKTAARIEGSKAWAKDLMQRHGIPCAASRAFERFEDALEYLDALGGAPVVIKADGLAAGKGVTVAQDRAEAIGALQACLVDRAFGEAGATVLIEERLSGPEVSAFALTDGREVLPLVLAQDFKRIGDGDEGPNTGGMGAYSPVPLVDAATEGRIWDEIARATVRAMDAEGVRFKGLLYAGLMLTEDGPKVLEFNCRFGDPETEAVLPRLRSDFGELVLATVEGTLSSYKAHWTDEVSVTVVLASGGYPGEYRTGMPIAGLEAAGEVDGVVVFHAGTKERQGRVVTAGGRVLAVSALGATLAEARARAYEAVERISFEGMQYRTDIAARAAEEERS
ncbi:MAG: phosphoribosylamine--glycine ligase [Actinobacteria bacterium]|nr:phosphoribosylamine--glycine ligase [Actinomycetota bacterium]